MDQGPRKLLPRVIGGPKLKSRVIPDQSLSIAEIVKRYVRGVPVDILQREPVYTEQTTEDLEKLSRMDFGEKHAYAQELGERAARLKADYQERDRLNRDAHAKLVEAKAKKAAQKAKNLVKRQPLDNQDGVN